MNEAERGATYDVGQDADVPDAVSSLLQGDELLTGNDRHPGGCECFSRDAARARVQWSDWRGGEPAGARQAARALCGYPRARGRGE